MDQATVARRYLEAMETRDHPLCRVATPRRRPGFGGANRRQPTWPLAAQQQPRAHHRSPKRFPRLARSCVPRDHKASLIHRTAVYGPVCTVVWEGEAARPTPIPNSPVRARVLYHRGHGPDRRHEGALSSSRTGRPRFAGDRPVSWSAPNGGLLLDGLPLSAPASVTSSRHGLRRGV